MAPWISGFPGLALVVIIVGLNLFGDGLRDALDPKAQIT
jgi:ABC-type dipeptide/oligopeptide/nickel transport system permease subunit